VSSFSVGGTGVTFTALDTSFNDRGGSLEEYTCQILVNSASEWGALFSLRSWNVTTRPIPGGNNVYVDIGGGAGVGTLTLDNLNGGGAAMSHQAVMTALSRDYVEPGSIRTRATATWMITS
jgi:hypothetical protein